MGRRFSITAIPITGRWWGSGSSLYGLIYRLQMICLLFSSSSHFFPQQSLCVASGTGPPEGPEVVLRGAGARWYPRLFEAARLKLARVFEATAFEAVGLEAGACVWSCGIWCWLRTFVNLRQTLILLDGRGVLFNPLFIFYYFFLLELFKKFYSTSPPTPTPTPNYFNYLCQPRNAVIHSHYCKEAVMYF